jgi:hypothetical protein
MNGVPEIKFTMVGVVGYTRLETLTETQIHAFDDQYFCHRCLKLALCVPSIHSIYYINSTRGLSFRKRGAECFRSSLRCWIMGFFLSLACVFWKNIIMLELGF